MPVGWRVWGIAEPGGCHDKRTSLQARFDRWMFGDLRTMGCEMMLSIYALRYSSICLLGKGLRFSGPAVFHFGIPGELSCGARANPYRGL
jgi:hypothetical protein